MKVDNKNMKKIIIFGLLVLTWALSILSIQAPQLGLAKPVYPRPQPDYVLYVMLISGLALVVYSIKNAVELFKASQV